MGVSSDGILAYGFDLGGEEEWLLKDVDKYGDPQDVFSFITADIGDDVYLDDEFNKALKEHSIEGISIVRHCSYEYPMYILSAYEIRAWRGSPKLFNPVDYADKYANWHTSLLLAIAKLDIRPKQEAPGWILTSMYG